MKKYNIILDNRHCDFEFMWLLLEIKRNNPEFFNDSIGKLSFYFMFPYSIWSLSRSKDFFLPFENIVADTNRLEDNNCDIYLDFENTNIKEKHFSDRYSNLVLEATKNKYINAVIYSDDLAKYIKTNYSNVNLIQSPIKNKMNIESPFEMNMIDYSLYCHRKDEIKNKPSTILMVNSFCYNSYLCSSHISDNILNYEIDKPNNCQNRLKTFYEMKRNKLFVPVEEMNSICNNDSIQNFFVKTNCENKFERLETYLYYIIKPQHINKVRLECLKAIC